MGGEKILTAELRRYLKHGHKFVEGWMLTAAGKMIATLSAVQEARHIGGNVAEIGIHHGKVFIVYSREARSAQYRSICLQIRQ